MDKLAPAAIVIIGIGMCVFHRRLGERQVQGQNLLWGFGMGGRSVRVSQHAILLVGVAAICLGIAWLLS